MKNQITYTSTYLQTLFNESRSIGMMAEVVPQIRVRADTQSREMSSKVETATALPLRDATNDAGNVRMSSPETVEGEIPGLATGRGQKPQR